MRRTFSASLLLQQIQTTYHRDGISIGIVTPTDASSVDSEYPNGPVSKRIRSPVIKANDCAFEYGTASVSHQLSRAVDSPLSQLQFDSDSSHSDNVSVSESSTSDDNGSSADAAIEALLNISHIGRDDIVSDNLIKAVSNRTQLVCSDCNKLFSDHSNLARHRRRHTGEKPYICTDCNRAFATSTNLVVHRRVHTGERPYACQHCGVSFVDSSSLRKHVRSHTGERPYVCDVPGCSKAFTRSGDLVVHKRVHSGERPYECDWAGCGKSFAQRSTLITHRHSHTGEKPYECVQCRSKFVSTSHLAAHRRSGKCLY